MNKILRLYVSDKLWAWLQKNKEETNTSIAETVRAALRDYIKKQEQEDK